MYPDDKETWRLLIDQNLPAEPGTTIEQIDFNYKTDFLERLQDTLGYGITMGFLSVRLFFDDVVTQLATIADKFDKAGGIMTGALSIIMQNPLLQIKASGEEGPNIIEILDDTDEAFAEKGIHNVKCIRAISFWDEPLFVQVGGEEGINWTNLMSASFEDLNFFKFTTFQGGFHSSENITLTAGKTVDGIDVSEIPTTYLALTGNSMTGDIEFPTATDGIILKDRVTATRYRLKIESGVLGIEVVV